ncbi:exosortase K [Flavobacterium nackdongense]|uniref:Exosortase K n=1 Tax=Flavobacterium nackdongense TaxID=2547394 RepID=A0A4P6YBU5_9FLAO|nr:exosortase K [Flavobacterium nackdongense]QBN18107.1 exosortase K [Flavobacterium nackdongense]
MITIKNTFYYLVAIVIFILLKFGYTIANTNDLFFLLNPTDKLVGLLTSSKSVYFADKGFYYQNFNVIIEKSCSGFNFLLLCFSMICILALKYIRNSLYKALIIPVALVSAYLMTIFVNVFRIFASIVLQHQTNQLLPQNSQLVVHETIGIITNLSFLLLGYYLLERFFKNNTNYEKRT